MSPFIFFKHDTIAEIHAYGSDTRRYREIYKGQVFRLIEKKEEVGCIIITFKRLNNDVMIYHLTNDIKDVPYIELESSEGAEVLFG